VTKNLTFGEPTKVIVLFTLPLLIGNLFQQLYSFTDAVVVGRMLNVNALAAVGAAGSLQFLLLGFCFSAATGLAIPIAKAYGAGDMSAMRRSFAAGLLLSVGITVVITIAGVFGSMPLLRLLETPPEIISETYDFLFVTFIGTVATMAFNFLSSAIRALGDSRTPLIILVFCCILNAGFVVAFIGWFGMGVGGAAAATVLAQLVSVVLCLVLIKRRIPELRLHREDFRFYRGEVAEPARIGLAMGFQMSIIAVGAVVLQFGINGLGAASVAAFTASMRVDQVVSAPLNSFGIAMATYVAQNRGARQWLRIRTGMFRIALVSGGIAVVLGMLALAFGTPIIQLFVGAGAPDVVAMGHQYLIVNGALYVLLAMVYLVRSAIQGMGLTLVPTISGIVELLVRAAIGLFVVTQIGWLGVCIAAPASWILGLAPMVISWFVERAKLIRLEKADAALAAEAEDPEPCPLAA
jgi:putative MATE family efflux protein